MEIKCNGTVANSNCYTCMNMNFNKFVRVEKHVNDDYYALKAKIDVKREFVIMKTKLTVLEKHSLC